MARSVTLTNLRAWARQLADVESDPNITDAELTALANRHLTEVYDALVDAGPPEYYAATTTVTTVASTTSYSLPADFRTLLDCFAHETGDERRSVDPMRAGDRARWKAPSGAWTITVEYIPAPGTLVLGGDTFDGVSGWEELIANLMARDVMVKRESDPGVVLNTIDRLSGRIAKRARNRDRGHPRYVTDLDDQHRAGAWGATRNVRVGAYRLRAGNIEFYEPIGTGAT